MNASTRVPGIVLTSLPALIVTVFLMIGAPNFIRAQDEIPRPEIPAGLRVKLLLLDGSTVTGRTGQPISTGVQLLMGNRLDLQVKEWDRVEIDTAWRRVGAHGGMGALIVGAVGVVVGITINHHECSQLALPVTHKPRIARRRAAARQENSGTWEWPQERTE